MGSFQDIDKFPFIAAIWYSFNRDLTISGVALLLAAITGLLYLYLGTRKPFGSIQDYLLAFLWGFGIDNSVRGFTDILKKISE